MTERVLLVHAGACDARMWDGFDLPGAERHELRGFGQTPLPGAGSFSHADDLEAALGDEPAALVGASYGGLVCLHVAARRPDLVPALILLDAPLPDHDWSPEVLEFAEQEESMVEQGDHRGAALLNAEFWTAPETPAAVRERVADMQERAFELQAGSEAEEEEPGEIDLGAVQARTLVVVGALDKRDFHDVADRLAREIPQAELDVVDGAGHLPALERPDQTAKLVKTHLYAVG
jgi:3-oxoadipate enol-lactonase